MKEKLIKRAFMYDLLREIRGSLITKNDTSLDRIINKYSPQITRIEKAKNDLMLDVTIFLQESKYRNYGLNVTEQQRKILEDYMQQLEDLYVRDLRQKAEEYVANEKNFSKMGKKFQYVKLLYNQAFKNALKDNKLWKKTLKQMLNAT